MTSNLTSTKPYLLEAFYNWIVDNQCTPYIIVDATVEDVNVPQEYAEEGRIVLNISADAINHYEKTHDFISFEARFSGEIFPVFIPITAIIAIYARENGNGMVFADKELDQSSPPPKSGKTTHKRPPRGKPKLTIVK